MLHPILCGKKQYRVQFANQEIEQQTEAEIVNI